MSEPAQVFHISKPQILWSLTEFTLQQLQHTQPHTLNTQSVSLDYTCYCKTRLAYIYAGSHVYILTIIQHFFSFNGSSLLWFWRIDQNNMLTLIIILWINVYIIFWQFLHNHTFCIDAYKWLLTWNLIYLLSFIG